MKIACVFNLSTFIMLKSCLVKTFTLNYPSTYIGTYAPALVAELATNRMWYVGGWRPDGAQVGRFTSWDTPVTKGFLAESAYFSSRISHSVTS